MDKNITLRTFSKPERNSFILSLAGQNIINGVIAAGLAYYLQFTIFIPAIIVGAIMASARVWDAVNDFFMGSIIDKTRSKWGKCRPYLIFAPLPILILTLLCFINFGFYGEGEKALDILIVVWAAAIYIIWGMFYTVGDIPLWGITALMTEDDKDRNKLLSLARIAGNSVSGIVIFAMVPLALAIGNWLSGPLGSGMNGERWGFFASAAIFAIIGYFLFQMVGFKVKERVTSNEKKYTLKENFRIIMNNKPFKQILLSGILGSPKMLMLLSSMPLVTYYFASKDALMSIIYMALLGAGTFIGMLISMGYTPALMKRFGKKNLYNYSNLIAVIPYLVIFILYLVSDRGAMATSPYLLATLFLMFTICGSSLGIFSVLQTAMIADCVDYEEYKTGTRPDGVFFAGLTFLAKLTTGIATIISAIAYSIVRFSDDNVRALNEYIENMGEGDPLPREMPQYDNFMLVLFFLISVPPAIGCLLTVIPTFKYVLDNDVHSKILNELNMRRHNIESDNKEETYEQ